MTYKSEGHGWKLRDVHINGLLLGQFLLLEYGSQSDDHRCRSGEGSLGMVLWRFVFRDTYVSLDAELAWHDWWWLEEIWHHMLRRSIDGCVKDWVSIIYLVEFLQ